MQTMPCRWFGITTNASNTISSRIVSDRFHSRTTIRPYAFSPMRPGRTVPKRHRRSCVQMVTKYAASLR